MTEQGESTARLVIELDGGGTATLLDTDGQYATLHVTRTAPPGTPLRGASNGERYEVKVRGCRRDGQDASGGPVFRVEGRWVNLSRAQRERLLGKG